METNPDTGMGTDKRDENRYPLTEEQAKDAAYLSLHLWRSAIDSMPENPPGTEGRDAGFRILPSLRTMAARAEIRGTRMTLTIPVVASLKAVTILDLHSGTAHEVLGRIGEAKGDVWTTEESAVRFAKAHLPTLGRDGKTVWDDFIAKANFYHRDF